MHPRIKIITPFGEMVFELFPEVALETVENFLELTESGFFNDGRSFFYRVIPDFVIQGGPLDEEGNQAPGPRAIKGEFGGLSHERGVISMARTADPDSAFCHFFICLFRLEKLDGDYAAFGRLIKGEEVFGKILAIPREMGFDNRESRPTKPIPITIVFDEED